MIDDGKRPDGRLDLEARLAELATRTSELRARGGFEARVMEALTAAGAPVSGAPRSGASPGELVDWIARSGRYALAVGALAAAAAVAVAVRSQGAYDAAVAVTYANVEVGW